MSTAADRISAEVIRTYHVCQTAEAVDGKSADDNGWSRTAETLSQLRDHRLGNWQLVCERHR